MNRPGMTPAPDCYACKGTGYYQGFGMGEGIACLHHVPECQPGDCQPECEVLHAERVASGDIDETTSGRTLGDDPGAIGYEAVCGKCGETFNPNAEEATRVVDGVTEYEHYQRFGPDERGEYETECGGFGPIVGSWSSPRRLYVIAMGTRKIHAVGCRYVDSPGSASFPFADAGALALLPVCKVCVRSTASDRGAR